LMWPNDSGHQDGVIIYPEARRCSDGKTFVYSRV
jgi:hypothetical protein